MNVIDDRERGSAGQAQGGWHETGLDMETARRSL
jgi:hypothetical protein